MTRSRIVLDEEDFEEVQPVVYVVDGDAIKPLH